ncbi:hypothetical protein GCM10028808_45760 [Spirosoma migulaei]
MKTLKWVLAEFKLYLCNWLIAKLPSRRVRLFFYKRIMKFEIGENSSIFMGAWITCAGNLKMENNSIINPNCHIDPRGGIYIGRNVSISAEVAIVTGDHNVHDPYFKARFRKAVIEDNVFIGFRALILGGVTIGRGSVIAAGSVVTKDVPPLTIMGGVPARKIGSREDNFKREFNYSRLFG